MALHLRASQGFGEEDGDARGLRSLIHASRVEWEGGDVEAHEISLAMPGNVIFKFIYFSVRNLSLTQWP